jgi:Short C-terminal domain
MRRIPPEKEEEITVGILKTAAQLKQLGELLSAGVLTQAEFEQQKARILG